jgi:hypothetical protein
MGQKYTLKDLELPDDEPMVIIRKSFLWICDGDKYAAAALNMYVHWTKWLMKRKPVAQEINNLLKKQGRKASQDTSLIIYRKQKELVNDLLDFCNEKRLRQANTFLEFKGLLRIDDTPRSNLDHVLKYELQIDVFKKCMEDWRKYRGDQDGDDDDETVEVALEADSSEADNSPSRNRQKTAPKQTIVGSEADNSPSLNRNIDNKRDKQRDKEERKNDAPHQTPNVTTQESSSIHSSTQSSFSEIELTEDERMVYELVKKKHISRLKKDEKHKDYCAQLIREGVTTLERIESLIQFCRQKTHLAVGKELYLKNLVNELDGWLQIQSQLPPAPEELPPVTDAEIAEKVTGFCRIYKDDSVEEHIQKVIQIQQQIGMNNNDMHDLLFEAKEETTYSGLRNMQSFFNQMKRILKQKHKILI